jgi:hypothetical protein
MSNFSPVVEGITEPRIYRAAARRESKREAFHIYIRSEFAFAPGSLSCFRPFDLS